VGPGERLGEVREETESLGDDRPARVQERSVPEAQLVAAGLFLPDRAEEAVPLLERPAAAKAAGFSSSSGFTSTLAFPRR